MKKWNSIDKATTPEGGSLHLLEHDGNYCIRINGHELMSTRLHASEETLATLTCQPLAHKKQARVLIGGLGFGYTLRAALAVLGEDAQIVVAELMPPIVRWNREILTFSAPSLADKRVKIIEDDVATVLKASASVFDVILLDIDNGPSGLSVASNHKLYQDAGLKLAKAALAPGGCLGVWSAAEDAAFGKRLQKAGFALEVQRAPAHHSARRAHTLFLGRPVGVLNK